MKKLLLVPFFGPLPEWYDKWEKSVFTLKRRGYELFITNDLEGFNKRCKSALGFKSSIVEGTGKLWDYRPTLGVMYKDVLEGFDFWGTTDLDVVYGNPDHFMPDAVLKEVDIISDEKNYIGGHWTLYRNIPAVNTLYMKHPAWTEILQDPKPSGWVETAYTEIAKSSGLRVKFQLVQASRDNEGLEYRDGCLYQNGKEVMLAHFKDQKRWPL